MCWKLRRKKEKINEKNKNDEESSNNIKFYNLSPEKIDDNSMYLKALDQKIKDEEVLNIAVTGRYGAGKSSVIKTYQDMHPEYKYLNISLASFKNNGQDNNVNIERSILQQLFYSVNPFKIPNSRFKRIKNLNDIKLMRKFCILIIAILMLIFSIYLLVNPQYINIYVLNGNIASIINTYFTNFFQGLFSILLFGFVLIIGIFILWLILKRILLIIEISNIKLKKESIEIEINGKDISGDSIFNKYIDEIIYFFEVTDYNIVIIEDLDRFKNSNDVFIKLRELNKIINSCETVDKKIKFIYAVKDEIFNGRDRIKFFDFILPIIPVINSANSRQKLLDKLDENCMSEILDEKYIRQITLYIDDMRLLNNIMNEFNIYKAILNLNNLSMENLFSIITFKNIYPEEFSKLQERKSIINDIFETKTERLEQYKEDLIAEEKSYENELDKIEKKDLPEKQKVELRNKFNHQLARVIIELNKVKTNKETTIKLLLKKFGVKNILTKREQSNKLLVFLLTNGYLQEDYQEYINYFYAGVLKENDKEFLINVTSHQKLLYNLKLYEIEEIIQSLSYENFKQKEILNFDLVDYILKNKKRTQEENSIFELLSNETEESIKFCIEYIKNGKCVSQFVQLLCAKWNGILNYLEHNNSDEEKRIVIYSMLKYAKSLGILWLENIEYLKEYISKDKNFVKMFTNEQEIENVKKILIDLNVKFKNLEIDDFNTELGKFIKDNNFYEISQKMIFLVLKNQLGEDINFNDEKNYIIIKEKIETEYKKNIENDIFLEFLRKIYLPKDIQETITMLNTDMIDFELKKNIVKIQKMKFTNLLDIKDIEIWDIVLIENKILPKWENIETYFKRKNITQTLIEYIKRNIRFIEMDKKKISIKLLSDLIKNIDYEYSIILLENQSDKLSEDELNFSIRQILEKNDKKVSNRYRVERDNVGLRLCKIIKANTTSFDVVPSGRYYIIMKKDKTQEKVS